MDHLQTLMKEISWYAQTLNQLAAGFGGEIDNPGLQIVANVNTQVAAHLEKVLSNTAEGLMAELNCGKNASDCIHLKNGDCPKLASGKADLVTKVTDGKGAWLDCRSYEHPDNTQDNVITLNPKPLQAVNAIWECVDSFAGFGRK